MDAYTQVNPREKSLSEKGYLNIPKTFFTRFLPNFKQTDTQVYFWCLSHCINKSYLWHSVPTIAEATGLGERTVQNSIKKFESFGLARKRSRFAKEDYNPEENFWDFRFDAPVDDYKFQRSNIVQFLDLDILDAEIKAANEEPGIIYFPESEQMQRYTKASWREMDNIEVYVLAEIAKAAKEGTSSPSGGGVQELAPGGCTNVHPGGCTDMHPRGVQTCTQSINKDLSINKEGLIDRATAEAEIREAQIELAVTTEEEHPSIDQTDSEKDDDTTSFQPVIETYHQVIGMMSPTQMDKLKSWHEQNGMEYGTLIEALCALDDQIQADLRENNVKQANQKRRFEYLEGILRNWYNEQILTAKAAAEKRESEKSGERILSQRQSRKSPVGKKDMTKEDWGWEV